MKKFHWFWAWEDEKEAAWLCEMSQKGWHFTSVSFPGNYTFTQGEATDYVYRLDYFTNHKNLGSYLQLFEDAGWNHLGKMNNWQYFRQEAIEGEVSEIHTDDESKSKKYRQIMMFLVILFPVFFPSVILLNREPNTGFMQLMAFLMSALLLFYIYCMVKLFQRITQLKKNI